MINNSILPSTNQSVYLGFTISALSMIVTFAPMVLSITFLDL